MKLKQKFNEVFEFANSLHKDMLLKYIELELENLNRSFPWIKTVSDAYHTRRIVSKSKTRDEAMERIESLFGCDVWEYAIKYHEKNPTISAYWVKDGSIRHIEDGAIDFLYALGTSACQTNRFYEQFNSDRNMIKEFNLDIRGCSCKECVREVERLDAC